MSYVHGPLFHPQHSKFEKEKGRGGEKEDGEGRKGKGKEGEKEDI